MSKDKEKRKNKKQEFKTYCIFTKKEQNVKETIGLIFKDYIENLKTNKKCIK